MCGDVCRVRTFFCVPVRVATHMIGYFIVIITGYGMFYVSDTFITAYREHKSLFNPSISLIVNTFTLFSGFWLLLGLWTERTHFIENAYRMMFVVFVFTILSTVFFILARLFLETGSYCLMPAFLSFALMCFFILVLIIINSYIIERKEESDSDFDYDERFYGPPPVCSHAPVPVV